MRICLVNPSNKEERSAIPTPPHGLLQIASSLASEGHEVYIADYSNAAQKLPYSKLNSYDLVGLSVMTPQLQHAAEIRKHIAHSTKVVWGGVHCLLDPASILNAYPQDFVISGEGEVVLSRLIDYIEGRIRYEEFCMIPGICLAAKNSSNNIINKPSLVEDINELPDLDYKLLPYLECYIDQFNLYFNKNIRLLKILVGRGCHWNCAFCINAVMRKHNFKYRKKSLAKVRRETERLIKDFGCELILPGDDDFLMDWDYLKEWMAFTNEHKLLWFGNARYNYFSDHFISADRLKQLSDSGLIGVGMSIEAGSESIRNKVLNKELYDRQIQAAVNIIKQSKLDNFCVNTSFITAFPGDTLESNIKTIQWMNYLSDNINVVFSGPQIYRPYPGSSLYKMENRPSSMTLNKYIEDYNVGGTELSKTNSGMASFLSKVLMRFFNMRFRTVEISVNSGKRVIRLSRIKGAPGIIRPEKFILNILCIPLELRLRYDYWRMFVEPKLIGRIYDIFQGIFFFSRSLIE